MITSAISSSTAVSPANWFGQHKVSCSAGSSFKLKDLAPSFVSSSSHVLGCCLAHPVMNTAESTNESNVWSHLSKNIDFPNYLDPVASYRTTSKKEKDPRKLNSMASQFKELDHHLVIQYPIITESAMKAILENNTLVFIVDKRADKNDVKDAVRIMLQIKAEKVNTLNLPNGAKKAYVKLGPGYNAIDVAKKIRIL
ncbi:large ribosomal subunit protein uL23-like [Primulina huaijiensis]|uniref:large ribosomal subunit protein uL23-like n=1 Tax=Primulina huaijiensis TaxID=1492673 RepID=UPI003CC72C54